MIFILALGFFQRDRKTGLYAEASVKSGCSFYACLYSNRLARIDKLKLTTKYIIAANRNIGSK